MARNAGPLAHSANAAGRTHDLAAHLDGVADLTAGFAAAFGSATYTRCAGLWHDLGKNNPRFQAGLGVTPDAWAEDTHTGAAERVGRAAAGAVHALGRFGPGVGGPLALVIASHHAGLADSTELFAGRLTAPPALGELAAALAHPGRVILERRCLHTILHTILHTTPINRRETVRIRGITILN